jgi:hypothetical protein
MELSSTRCMLWLPRDCRLHAVGVIITTNRSSASLANWDFSSSAIATTDQTHPCRPLRKGGAKRPARGTENRAQERNAQRSSASCGRVRLHRTVYAPQPRFLRDRGDRSRSPVRRSGCRLRSRGVARATLAANRCLPTGTVQKCDLRQI